TLCCRINVGRADRVWLKAPPRVHPQQWLQRLQAPQQVGRQGKLGLLAIFYHGTSEYDCAWAGCFCWATDPGALFSHHSCKFARGARTCLSSAGFSLPSPWPPCSAPSICCARRQTRCRLILK